MKKPFPVAWFGLLALVIMAGGSFVMGLGHVYEPERYCASPHYAGVCAGMLFWFGLGSALAMLSMAKLFDDAMRFLDSQQ
ncbi:hypothetical protein DT603_03530 [Pseudoxanthomonas gei]|uniref:Transmembrane protein n=1 Tax=Pseudoxanthomonas gei TaxID=1383030 RepID=A0ABX0A8Q4_9GAMM|nr:hypothetical protein [Pseudoxanthomonas gei]NDK37909.1 hypothetical protein [Pseudoxanthomonas gei]